MLRLWMCLPTDFPPESRVKYTKFSLLIQFIEECDCSAEMGNDNGSSYRQRDAKDFKHLIVGHPLVLALHDMIRYTIVASQHHRRHQSEHLLRLLIEVARLIRQRVDAEEALDRPVVF